MVRLENITIKENIISCDYYPESTNDKGYIEVDIKEGNTTNEERSFSDNEGCYSYHARRALIHLIESYGIDSVPKKHTELWH